MGITPTFSAVGFQVALVVESGEVKQVHDFCVLLGFGADAICPYMVFETCYRLRNMGLIDKSLTDDKVSVPRFSDTHDI